MNKLHALMIAGLMATTVFAQAATVTALPATAAPAAQVAMSDTNAAVKTTPPVAHKHHAKRHRAAKAKPVAKTA